MKILIDHQLPFTEIFSVLGEVITLPSEQITPSGVKEADALIVRTVTPVNQFLLEDSQVQFVGAASSGIDHVDTLYLSKRGIAFADTRGCNAQAVAEYVVSCMLAAPPQHPPTKRVGIIGVGQVGSRVQALLTRMGYEILCYDPPRAEREPSFIQTPLEAFKEVDAICCHPSLSKTGPHPSERMIDKTFLLQQQPGTLLLNASRSAVLDYEALYQYGRSLLWCFDVWPNEPFPNPQLVQAATLATPHIAGYSALAKHRAMEQLFQSACQYFHQTDLLKRTPDKIQTRARIRANTWESGVLQAYDPRVDTALLKQNPTHFSALRANRLTRLEWSEIIWDIETGSIPSVT